MSIRDYDSYIEDAAAKNGLNPDLLRAVMEVESGGNPRASSGKAFGVMQFTPDTARSFGINPLDPVQSIYAGAKYLRQNHDRFGGDTNLALAAYNAGPEAVAKYGGIPPFAETRAYVPKVYGAFQKYASLRTGTATDAQPMAMARQTATTPEVQPVNIQRNITPITGLTRTEDVVNQVAPVQQKQEDEFDPIAFQQRAMADSQGATKTSDEFDPIAFQKRAEAARAAQVDVAQPVQQSLQDAILQGSDVGGQVSLTPGDLTNQIAAGAGRQLARTGGKYGSMVSPQVAHALSGNYEAAAAAEKNPMSRVEDASRITGQLADMLGVDMEVPRTGDTTRDTLAQVMSGAGGAPVALAELLGVGKFAAPLVSKVAAPAAQAVGRYIGPLIPADAAGVGGAVSAVPNAISKISGYIKPQAIGDAATFAANTAMEPGASLGDVAKSAAVGSVLGQSSGLSAAKRVPIAIAAGQAAMPLEAPMSDRISNALQMAGYSGYTGGGEKRPAPSSSEIRKITDYGWDKGVKPTKAGNKTWNQQEFNRDNFASAATYITQVGRQGKLELPSGSKIPKSNLDQLKAINDSLDILSAEQARDLSKVTGAEVTVPKAKVLDALKSHVDELSKSASPSVDPGLKYAQRNVKKLERNIEKYGPDWTMQEALDEIARINNNKNYRDVMRNPTPDAEAAVVVDKMYVDAIRNGTMDAGKEVVGDRFRLRRALMRDLINLRDPTAYRAIVEARRVEHGIESVTDPVAAAQLAVGLVAAPFTGGASLKQAAHGLVMKAVSSEYRAENQPSNIIRKMYQKLDATLGPQTPWPEAPERQPEQIIDLTDRLPTYEETVPTVGAQSSSPVGVPAAGTIPGIKGPGEPSWNRQQFKIIEKPQPVGARVRDAIESPAPLVSQGVPSSQSTGMPPQSYGPRIDRQVVDELPKNIVLKSARPDFGVRQELSLPYVEGGKEVPASVPERMPRESYEVSREREILESLPKWRKVVIKSARPDYAVKQKISEPYVGGATEVPASGSTGLPSAPQTVRGGSAAREAVMDFLDTQLGYAKVKSIGNLIEQASAAKRPSQRAMDVVDLLNQISDTISTGQEMSVARHLVDQLQEKLALSQRGKK